MPLLISLNAAEKRGIDSLAPRRGKTRTEKMGLVSWIYSIREILLRNVPALGIQEYSNPKIEILLKRNEESRSHQFVKFVRTK